jgi:hypothetical protein
MLARVQQEDAMSDPGPRSVRLEPADELMHANTGEPNFNESMYFNFFDPRRRVGGFLRLGNRPNEGHAETTVCLWEPDGSVRFHFLRPEIPGNDAFDAGGVRFEVKEPFERLRISYRGAALHLREPLQMSDPRRAYATNPMRPVEVDLEIRGVGPMVGGERARPASDHEQEFARAAGRRPPGTAGSPRTSPRTSASWAAGSPRATARSCAPASCSAGSSSCP